MPPTTRWPGVPSKPAAAASAVNFFSVESSPPATRKTTFGPEVPLEEMRCYGALLSLRSPRTPFLANFRVADPSSLSEG
jgi:hypothetical protein